MADTATPNSPKRRKAARIGERTGTGRRGFASMDPEKHRQIASADGKAAHANGNGRKWTTETAREAAYKSGRLSKSELADQKSPDN